MVDPTLHWTDPERDRQRAREYYQKNREEIRKRQKMKYDPVKHAERYAQPLVRAKSLYHGAAARAKAKGIEFNLSLDWVVSNLAKGCCAVTGIPFTIANQAGQKGPFSPSIDKIDPKKGYTEDNCRMVLLMYNSAKGPWSDALVLEMAKAICQMKQTHN